LGNQIADLKQRSPESCTLIQQLKLESKIGQPSRFGDAPLSPAEIGPEFRCRTINVRAQTPAKPAPQRAALIRQVVRANNGAPIRVRNSVWRAVLYQYRCGLRLSAPRAGHQPAPLACRFDRIARSAGSWRHRRSGRTDRRRAWPVNHERTYRLYSEEGRSISAKVPRRKRAWRYRVGRPGANPRTTPASRRSTATCGPSASTRPGSCRWPMRGSGWRLGRGSTMRNGRMGHCRT